MLSNVSQHCNVVCGVWYMVCCVWCVACGMWHQHSNWTMEITKGVVTHKLLYSQY